MVEGDPRDRTFHDWIKAQVESVPFWFHRMELPNGLVTPGWSDPKVEKLPYFGLPDDMTGMRVLDIGHAEGFFSFEAERRGAVDVLAIDVDPKMIMNFNICRSALNSRVRSLGSSVYDLDPKVLGTFDMVFFFGVLYHLRHPLLALEKVFSICAGTLLMQSVLYQDESETPLAEFHPFGMESGPPGKPMWDPTCFWFPNAACCMAMLRHVGFEQVERLSPTAPAGVGGVFRAKSPGTPSIKGKKGRPVGRTAPWS